MSGLNRAGVVEDAFALVGICTVAVGAAGAAVSAAIIAGQWWRAWNARRAVEL